jgi:hypothetical protein
MSHRQKIKGFSLAVAAAALFPTIVLADQPAAQSPIGKCYGGNQCKGKSSCKSAINLCKGQNACRGQGFVVVFKKEDCNKPGRRLEPAPSSDGSPSNTKSAAPDSNIADQKAR